MSREALGLYSQVADRRSGIGNLASWRWAYWSRRVDPHLRMRLRALLL